MTPSAPDRATRRSRSQTGDVAIDDHRNRNRLPDRVHRGPIGFAFVELAARAAMYGDRSARRRLRRGAPALARCGCDRPSRAASSASPALSTAAIVASIRLWHDRDRASAPSPSRPPVTFWAGQPMLMSMMSAPASSADPRAFGHPARLAARQLDHMRTDAGGFAAQPGNGASLDQIVAGGHLGNHESRTEGRGEPTKRSVSDAGHRREEDRIGEVNIADFQWLSSRNGRTGHRVLLVWADASSHWPMLILRTNLVQPSRMPTL